MNSVKKTIGTMFTFLLTISLAISVICFFMRNHILNWLNTPSESYAFTLDYTVTCIVGLFFIYGYNIISAILRGMGDSRRPFMFIAIAALLNIVMDIWLVASLHMEVFGAALATVISQAVSFIVALVYLYRRKESFGFDFKLQSFRIDRFALKRLVALGVPMAIQSAAVSLSKVVLMSWINMFGVVYSALAGIFNKVNVMIGIVSNSFTAAGSTMVGQNLGAKQYERVPRILKTVGFCTMLISTVFAVGIGIFQESVYQLFTSDGAVLAVADILLIPIILNFYGAATRSIGFSLINGSGNTKLNYAVAVFDGIISRIGIAALLGFVLKMECEGFWYGDAFAGFIPIIIGMCYFISGNWKKR